MVLDIRDGECIDARPERASQDVLISLVSKGRSWETCRNVSQRRDDELRSHTQRALRSKIAPMDLDRLRLAVAREASATSHALTLKGIRRKTIPLRQIAEQISEALEVRVEQLFAMSQLGHVACGADCAYCCYVPRVLVTLPELAQIVERVQTWPVNEIEALRARLEAHILAQSSDAAAPAARPPCAFLVGRRCSVYDARPLVCRGQHAYDVQEC
jgi:hypothetical protein